MAALRRRLLASPVSAATASDLYDRQRDTLDRLQADVSRILVKLEAANRVHVAVRVHDAGLV